MYLILDRFLDRDWVGVWHFLGALALFAAAAALLFVTIGGASEGGRTAAQVAPPRVSPPRVRVRTVAAGESFTVAGAAFTVLDGPRAGWARHALAFPHAPGARLVVAAVDVVGRGRAHLNPALLSYLVRGPGGALYAPLRSGVVGPNSISQTRGLGSGEKAQERLLFSLPKSVRDPVLAIQPAATKALEVRVPLARRP
ncbi:MAG: hypothetical protein JSU06_05785 [Actinobacteria bacterium]|nr:hypothetical protein [Actinomycetota bacterium]